MGDIYSQEVAQDHCADSFNNYSREWHLEGRVCLMNHEVCLSISTDVPSTHLIISKINFGRK